MGQKIAKMAKNAKVAKSPQIRLQGDSRGFRGFQVSNSMGSDDSGTYARTPYEFTALVQGPKVPELVKTKNILDVFCPINCFHDDLLII